MNNKTPCVFVQGLPPPPHLLYLPAALPNRPSAGCPPFLHAALLTHIVVAASVIVPTDHKDAVVCDQGAMVSHLQRAGTAGRGLCQMRVLKCMLHG